MKFQTKYKLCLLKRYFDTGFGVTNYFKYFIAFFGLASGDAKTTLIIAAVYGILCFLIGWWWIQSDFIIADQEVSNAYNLFVTEVRKKLNGKNNGIKP